MGWPLLQNAKASLSAINMLLIKHIYLERLTLISHAVQRMCDLLPPVILSKEDLVDWWWDGEGKGRTGERGCC